MQVPDIHAPRNEDDTEVHSVSSATLEDADELAFGSFDDPFWPLPGYEHHDPLIDGPQTYLSQPAYAPHDEYADHDCTGFPVISDVHQTFTGNGEHHRPCSQLSFGRQWFQHEHSIPDDQSPNHELSCTVGFATTDQHMVHQAPDAMLNLAFHDAEGSHHTHSPLSLANDGQGAMTVWEDTHVSSASDHHPAIAGGDAGGIGPAPHPTPSGGGQSVLRCQHYVQGQPCGVLIEDGVPGILEHIACKHVHPRTFAKATSDRFWTCHWGGECDSRIRKEGFRRHVLCHLVRWKCTTCSSTYSRGDTARKHAKDCGHGRVVMKSRSEVRPRRR